MKKWKIIFLSLLVVSIISCFSLNTISKYSSSISKTISITYSKPQYTIKFNANGGTGTMADMNVKRTVSQTLTTNSFTRSGYDFIGWNTASDGSGISYSDGAEIAYASITDGDVITLYAQWFNKDYLNGTAEVANYSCEEEVKTYTVTLAGKYILEAWGAQGGSVSSNTGTKGTVQAVEGGRGGYSYEIVNLNAGDQIYVAVGCHGVSVENSPSGTTGAGGYNGGGLAVVDGTGNYSGSGGGATHFAINNNLGELKNYSNNQSDVLLVAGGGGGSYNNRGIYYYSYGGFGGGITGGQSISFYNTGITAHIGNNFVYYQGLSIPGANQTLQTGTDYTYGTFGKGVDAMEEISGTDSGAGGGWYGGNRLIKPNTGGGMAGSGGSGHVNTTDSKYVDGKTIAGNLQIPTHDGASYMTGNTGDGYARISFVNPHYKVKFDANGGTGTMSDQDFVYGTAQNLTNNAFTKTNYAFIGWNTAANGSGTSYTNGQEVNNLSTTEGDEITLYAQWIAPNIYFQVPPDWKGSTYNVYFFNTDTLVNSGWPGEAMILADSTKNIYYHKLTDYEMATYDRVIFTNGQNVDNSSGLNTDARQTIDTVLTSDLYGKILVPELYSENGVRVFFRSGTTSWIPFIYLWGSNGENGGWPGVQLTEKINKETYLSIIDTNLYNMMIFNKGTGGSGNQTADLNVPIYQDLTFNLNSGPYRIFYYGSWHNYNNWQSTEYNAWSSATGDYTKFQDAQSGLGY